MSLVAATTERLRRRLPVVHAAVDAATWVVTIPVVVALRYEIDPRYVRDRQVAYAVATAVALQITIGLIDGLYRRRWRYGSFDEMRVVAITASSVGFVVTVLWWNVGGDSRPVPRSAAMLAAGAALLGQIAVRATWRSYVEHRRRVAGGEIRALVVGAGDAGDQLVRTLRVAGNAPFVPVAFLDDDPTKRHLRLSGVRVEGTVDQLEQVARRFDAMAVLVAAPSVAPTLLRRVLDRGDAIGIGVFTLPPVEQLFGHVDLGDIRPLTDLDLLGRHPAQIDPGPVSAYLAGRRILVTGAGGSIGTELCRQIARFEPASIVLLDRDERGLHGAQLSMTGAAMLDDPTLVLADLRDSDRVEDVFATHRPEVVFHAAALKHLPLLEHNCAEAWKTNVVGTQTVLDAAQRHDVRRLVNISTDKAADPISVLGWTKRIAERLTSRAAEIGPTACVSVRFGNVLGSSASVVPTFEAQSARGGPLTVTHPDVTRYFMTVEEAVRLTIYAGAIGEPGEVLILDMGDPVRILDVAQRFARRHDPPLEIVITGLRENEKLREDLMSRDEVGEQRVHEMITHVRVPPLAADQLDIDSVPDVERIRSIALAAAPPRVSNRIGP